MIPTSKLRQILVDYFSESELHNLAFDLGVDYENLPGKSKGDKGRELITFLDHRGRLAELIRMIRQVRPDMMKAAVGGETDTSQANKPTYQAARQHRDSSSHYEIGLTNLLDQMGQDHSRYVEALGYQTRLQENTNWTRRHGNTETRRAERAEIIGQLNQLTLAVLSKSFNTLCEETG